MIIVVCGPTGVGKTKMSVELAKKYDAVILNADSMQVYKELNIGTAKVTEDEKQGVPHYLFDIKEPDEMYTVFDYQKDLRQKLEEFKDKNIVIVGGTGLYIKAALYNYEFNVEEESNTYDDLSNEELYEEVHKINPDSETHVNNRKRLIRELNRGGTPTHKDELLYPAIFIGLTTDRETLYNRIDKRVDIMVEDGLIDEVKSLYDRNIRSKAIMTGIGYKELYEEVHKINPDSETHVNNRKRLIRELNRKGTPTNKDELLYPAIFIGLTTDRETLYNRIDKRVDIMVEDGLIDEVKSLYDRNIRSKAIMTGIGYKELYEYFDGNLTLDEALDLIKQRSRKYAKRQYTWFNNQMDVKWFDVDFNDFNNTINECIDYIESIK